MSRVKQKNQHEKIKDRRSGFDRRFKQSPSLKELFIHRRRDHLRREDDRHKVVLFDRYSGSDMRIVIAILLLSIIDAFLTIFLLSHGAVELNPIMAYFLNINALSFILVKYGLTALSVITIVILHYTVIRYFRLPTRYLLDCFAGIFALVVAWEIFLIVPIFL
jgi:Domain of unknown function (DUF5658)